MEALSQKFEQEDGILEEVQQQILRGDDMYLQAKLFPCSEGEAYTAYCEIDSSVNGKEPIKSRGAEVTDPTSAFSGRSPSLPVNVSVVVCMLIMAASWSVIFLLFLDCIFKVLYSSSI